MANEDSPISGVASRYASALFSLATERGEVDKVAQDLDSFSTLMGESADLRRLVLSPVFSAQDQTNALSAVLARAGVDGLAANFLKLAATKRRLFLANDMIRAFRALLDKKRGVTRAEATFAEPISAERMAIVEQALREATGAQRVDVTVKIDPAIIGGLIVRVGSRMVDGSLRTKLNSLRTRMKEVR